LYGQNSDQSRYRIWPFHSRSVRPREDSIDLDIDRQRITRFGTPAEIDALIRKEVKKLGSAQGGLMMVFGLYPGTPLENVKALMDVMKRSATYYSRQAKPFFDNRESMLYDPSNQSMVTHTSDKGENAP